AEFTRRKPRCGGGSHRGFLTGPADIRGRGGEALVSGSVRLVRIDGGIVPVVAIIPVVVRGRRRIVKDRGRVVEIRTERRVIAGRQPGVELQLGQLAVAVEVIEVEILLGRAWVE